LLTFRHRGPIKGYTEALENRLDVTEKALERLLSVVEPSIIENAFDPRTEEANHQAHPRTAAENQHVSHNLSSEDKTSLMAQWDKYPLQTVADLQSWASNYRKQQEQAVGSISPATVLEGAPPYLETTRNQHMPGRSDTNSLEGRHDDCSRDNAVLIPEPSQRKDTVNALQSHPDVEAIETSTRGNPQINSISWQFRQEFLW
jgi:hypothetical protein